MRVAKKKIQEGFAKAAAKQAHSAYQSHLNRLKRNISSAVDSVKTYQGYVSNYKNKAAKAREELSKFLKTKKVPDDILTSYAYDEDKRRKLERLQRKMELTFGDEVNVTDAELDLLC